MSAPRAFSREDSTKERKQKITAASEKSSAGAAVRFFGSLPM
jgi:hypothetical protein